MIDVPPWLVAFLFHAPGLRLFTQRRLTPYELRLNVFAGSLTVAAMIAAGVARGPWAAFGAWAVGHLAWSITLAVLVSRRP